ncbi:MAG: maltose ABC transporter permease MalF, partial [Proteobacteria bacterium]|nr:maltose ABC transporter permease MalF [Pseudomonadota bacterium]
MRSTARQLACWPNDMISTSQRPSTLARSLSRLALAALTLCLLWLSYSLWWSGQALTAVGALALGGSALLVYSQAQSVAWKYLFPGVAAMLLFVAFPLLYTVQIGFTNFSSSHLLDLEHARAYLLEQSVVDQERSRPYTLHRDGDKLRFKLSAQEGKSDAALVSSALDLNRSTASEPLAMQALGASVLRAPLNLRELLQHRDALSALQLRLPDGQLLRYAGLREFGPIEPLWRANADGSLTQVASASLYRANPRSGFFETDAGERMQTGFKVNIGLANYSRMLLDADFRGPFVSIFVWTVLFAALTVLFSTALGMTLAVLLEWPTLKYRA